MDTSPSDEQLMLRYGSGDAAAFDLLYARHRGGVYRYLVRQCGNRATAEELFQDTWMNLIQARTRYRVDAKFATYLYTIAHNRLMDYFRRQRATQTESLDEEADESNQPAAAAALQPDRIAESREQAARLLALVQGLPQAQREVFLLHEEAGLALDEIADVTGANREAVKSRLRYALSKLREGMKEYW
jgi:RNA polymerase sigma-70 factor, ECF subfamily